MPTLVQSPFPIFTDVDGDPLEDGYVYIGIANLNPLSNPQQAYWDAAMTVPATNIRTKGGYTVHNGSPSRLYVPANYSVLVKNKNSRLVYSNLDSTDYFNAPAGSAVHRVATLAALRFLIPGNDVYPVEVLGYYAAGDGGGGPLRYWDASSVAADNGGTIIAPNPANPGRWVIAPGQALAPEWFGAKGDGVTDDLTALTAAIAAAGSGGALQLGARTYYSSIGLSLPARFTIQGKGSSSGTCAIVVGPTATHGLVLTNGYYKLNGFTLSSGSATFLAGATGIIRTGVNSVALLLEDVKVNRFEYGLKIDYLSYDVSVRRCLFTYNETGTWMRGCNHIGFIDTIINGGSVGAYFDYGYGVALTNCTFESNTTYGLRLTGTADVAINGCYVEGYGVHGIFLTESATLLGLGWVAPDTYAKGISISGCHFLADATYDINVQAGIDVAINGCYFREGSLHTAAIYVGSNTHDLVIISCKVEKDAHALVTGNTQSVLTMRSGRIGFFDAVAGGIRELRLSYAAAEPTLGTFDQGDIIFSRAYTKGGPAGWKCITAGVAGAGAVFVPFGQLGYRSYAGVLALTPFYIGERAWDTTYSRWFVATGAALGNWAPMSYNYRSAATVPGVLVPYFIGEEAWDTGTSQWYKAKGLTNADWIALN